MNKKETAEAIEVMQAFVDGIDIQWQGGLTGKWRDHDNNELPQWIWGNEQYRIKPKLREFWIHGVMACRQAVEIDSPDVEQPNEHYIKVREVIGD